MTTKAQLLLDNAVKLADHHRRTCEGEGCTISLYLLLELLRKARIDVPQELLGRFL
jgi:hypothetical protein